MASGSLTQATVLLHLLQLLNRLLLLLRHLLLLLLLHLLRLSPAPAVCVAQSCYVLPSPPTNKPGISAASTPEKMKK
jgi:hypothetical protein